MSRTSKYYITKETRLIVERILHIKQMYTILKNIKPNKEFSYIHMKLNYTMSVIEKALIDKIILELCCITIDKDPNDLCIPRLIIKYNENEEKFKVKKYIFIKDYEDNKHKLKINNKENLKNDFKSLEEFYKSNTKIMSFLKKYRDKQLAHNDKKQYFHKNNIYPELRIKVTFEELEVFINTLFSLMNNIYFSLSGIQIVCNDLGLGEIKYLNSILCEDYKRRNKKTTR